MSTLLVSVMSQLTRRLLGTRLVPALAGIALAFLSSSAYAQQRGGDVRGTVTDARTHTAVIGARVAIIMPARVAIADQRGMYTLRDLPAGTYVVTTSAI